MSNDDTPPPPSLAASVKLLHHGAAASSHRGVVAWVPPPPTATANKSDPTNNSNTASSTSTLVYASHSVLNLAQSDAVLVNRNDNNGSEEEEEEPVWHVTSTLCTTTGHNAESGSSNDSGPEHVITCLSSVVHDDTSSSLFSAALVAGFANGTLTLWTRRRHHRHNNNENKEDEETWSETALVVPSTSSNAALLPITCLDSHWVESQSTLLVLVGTSSGARLYECRLRATGDEGAAVDMSHTKDTVLWKDAAVCSVLLCQHNLNHNHKDKDDPANSSSSSQQQQSSSLLALIGTAAPRHNKIHVWHANVNHHGNNDDSNKQGFHFYYSGSLTGHEDWIACMDWTTNHKDESDGDDTTTTTTTSLLATGSQDARIRLWKFAVAVEEDNETIHTTSTNNDEEEQRQPDDSLPNPDERSEEGELSDDNDEAAAHEEAEAEEEEGESRLDIYHHHHHLEDNKTSSNRHSYVTRVTLEALLIGHEEAVTSVCWYRHSKSVYHQPHVLMSSSMDRSLLFWAPSSVDGIWTPLTRVGGAGGILGGSVGSTLLGYLDVTVEPCGGASLLGHAYGGALHVWNLWDPRQQQQHEHQQQNPSQQMAMTTEELASSVYWKASPCITGHFSGVVDLCWEASRGHYLLTVSEDQTCRLWAPSQQSLSTERLQQQQQQSSSCIWLELARPQVHGYNMAAVTSLSCTQHPHFMVSGGDEKELRAFEAPQMTLRMLENVSGMKWSGGEDPTKRVERAYIPSLGLSNKATVADSAEEDAPVVATSSEPSSSTITAAARLPLERDLGVESLWPEVQKLFGHTTELYCITSTLEAQSVYDAENATATVLVASSCKARDEAAAAIRLWRAHQGTCHQVLSGGHKSTVATLAFSPNGGQLLASSGKDRRLCLWKKRQDDGHFSLAWAKESAHKRIVWSVHFLPYQPDNDEKAQILASGSRDGVVKIWFIMDGDESDKVKASVLCSFAPAFQVGGKPDSVTSLSFCPFPMPGAENTTVALLALGLESGRIELWAVPLSNASSGDATLPPPPSLVVPLEPNLCHKATVKTLAWKPVCADAKQPQVESLTLASCSMDHGCRLFEIKLLAQQ